MPHQFVIDVATDALLVDRERFHSKLHTIKRRGFPNEVGGEVESAVRGNSVVPSQLEGDFVRDVCEKTGLAFRFSTSMKG